jgi:ankyrin repeat protein/ppGpp synthetase/RelA/SpoT-type nucleotidyltranferase
MASTPDSSLCNQKVRVFLEEYKKTETQKLVKDFAEVTRQKCEELLKSMTIKGVVQSRSKGYDSLETKLNGMAKTSEFMKWVAGTDNGGDLHLPGNFPNVAEETRKMKKIQQRTRGLEGEAKAPGLRARLSRKGTDISEEPNVSGDAKDDVDKQGEENSGECDKRGRSIYEHPDLGDLAGVRIGLFFPGDVAKVAEEINKIFNVSHTFGTVTDTTRSAVDGRNRDIQIHGDGRWISQGPGQDVHHWEHYGYKSWQVVVEWKQPLPKDLESIEAALATTEVFSPLRVEIQVGTVVTQAWAEVQHNIIYKSSNDIKATTTMKRMIDAINGLAITTDIMLTELERSLVQAEKEAEERRASEKRLPRDMLVYACGKGDLQSVKRLLKDGVDVNAKDDYGWTALHYASQNGHDKVVEQLLVKDGVDVNATDNDGLTALRCASQGGHDKVVEQILVKDGVDMNATDNKGRTALHQASRIGHDEVVEQLLVKDGVDMNAKDNDGWTALHYASQWGHDKVVEQLLVKDGVDVNAKDNDGWTVLHYASQNGHDKVVEQLLVKDGVDVNAKDNDGLTALYWASQRGHDEIVEQLLIKDGVDVNAKDVHGWTALHRASQNGHDKTVEQLLIRDGVDVNAKSIYGWTVLHYASQRGHDKVVEQLLVKDGVDVNAKDNNGLTALHWASGRGYNKVVEQLLVKDGVNVNAKNDDGWTALDYASQRGHYKVVEQLRSVN